MNLIDLASRNLSRRPVRSLLTILGVGFAVGSFIVLFGLSRSVDENTQTSLDERGAHLTITRRGSGELLGGTLPLALKDKIAAVPGVAAVTGEMISLAPAEGDTHIFVGGWPEDSFFWQRMPIREGRLPKAGERKVAVIGDAIAAALKKNVGDTIEILGTKFQVIGISGYTAIINRSGAVMPLADLHELTFRDGTVTLFHVRLTNPGDANATERISRDIEQAAPVTVSSTENALKHDRFVGLLRAVSSTMAWVSLLMGVLMVLNTLLMAVLERTREIGIMASIGWSQSRIMALLMIEGLILSIVGSILGVLIAIGGAKILNTIPAIGQYIAVKLTPGLVIATVIAAVGLGILGSLYPAWLATRQSPAAALDRA